MTQYDPFSCGAAPMSQKGALPTTPADTLFAETPSSPVPTSRKAAKAPARSAGDADWAPVADDGFAAMLTLGAMPQQATANALAFGADALGEVAPVASAAPNKAPTPPHGARAPKGPIKPKEALPRRLTELLPAPPKSVSAAGAAMAMAFAAAGLAWSSWLFFAAGNPILAAIVAAAALVGGAMVWLLLRR
ncbi:MAG: hypothetical protein FJ301_02850 [Planctomycetes bacterium]|nr:hypothetical protein [Planctomycetota bacterium]